jgi:hypothetical protein
VRRDTKPGRVRNPAGGATIGTAIANIITSLLTYGQGLWVGPDSDGACNLGLDVGNTNSNMPQPGDLPAQTAAGAVAPASQPQSQVEGSQAQVPASGPGWKDTVVCGLTVCELAQQATPEVLRLRTKVQACSQAEKAAAAQLTRARRALTTRQKAVTEQVSLNRQMALTRLHFSQSPAMLSYALPFAAVRFAALACWIGQGHS